MYFDKRMFKIGQEITKLLLFEDFNMADIGAAILNIKWGFKNLTTFKSDYL